MAFAIPRFWVNCRANDCMNEMHCKLLNSICQQHECISAVCCIYLPAKATRRQTYSCHMVRSSDEIKNLDIIIYSGTLSYPPTTLSDLFSEVKWPRGTIFVQYFKKYGILQYTDLYTFMDSKLPIIINDSNPIVKSHAFSGIHENCILAAYTHTYNGTVVCVTELL